MAFRSEFTANGGIVGVVSSPGVKSCVNECAAEDFLDRGKSRCQVGCAAFLLKSMLSSCVHHDIHDVTVTFDAATHSNDTQVSDSNNAAHEVAVAGAVAFLKAAHLAAALAIT